VGWRRATADEWREYYERAARARAVVGDPFERHIRKVRVRNAIFNACVALLFLGVTAAVTMFAFSYLGG